MSAQVGAGDPSGWADVESKAGQVEKINPQAIQGVADQYTQASKNAGDHSAQLANAARGLQSNNAWTGPDAEAFFNYVSDIGKAGQQVNDKLDEVGGELGKVQETLTRIKGEIKTARDEARTAIDKTNQEAHTAAQDLQQKMDSGAWHLPMNTPDAVLETAKNTNEQTAKAAQGRIDGLLSQADEAIKKAQGLMQQEVGGGFASMSSPGSNGTTPSSSGPISGGGDTDSGSGSSGGSGGGSGGGGGGLGSSGGPPSSGPPPGNVKQWISEAIKVLQQNGVPVTEADSDKIWTIIQKESGGDPHSINNWDSNAQKGTPSKGLMQCIDPTFNSNKVPGHDDIYNPVDNICAGVNYTFERYGGFEGHPGLKAMSGGGGYQGY